MRQFGGKGARACAFPRKQLTARRVFAVCSALQDGGPLHSVPMVKDVDSDDDSVLTADSAATVVYENQLAAAEPEVAPTMMSVEALRKKKRMRTMLLLWTEFWAEESSLVSLGIAPSQASRAKSKHLRDSINSLAMPTGKDALGYPCGADFSNHIDVRTICVASTSCSFLPQADKLDVWYEFCQPFGEVDFDPRPRPLWHNHHTGPWRPWHQADFTTGTYCSTI